ncbi:pyroglutamyl peptidase [Kitasatospora sp. NPDC002227]|uniref:pyroglutamyl peptidase n=1 Tax=Kitasatospora sp. NPDC002227 TaxID=3154773 RepID=UPI003326363A
MKSSRAWSLVGVSLLASLVLPVSAARAQGGDCLSVRSPVVDVEQQRLADPRTGLLIAAGGLTPFVERFPAALCGMRSAGEARELVRVWGSALWQSAVRRAQGPGGGSLAAGDDRPLYWARLALDRQLDGWQPEFAVDAAGLRQDFEDASRGLTDNDFRGTPGVRRLFISGFDPFGLDAELRRANPSGSVALSLNGRRVTLADGERVEIRAVVLPVRYADFDRGMVERAFGRRMAPGPRSADRITTISQGYPGKFTLEAWAGRARSADPYPDNEGALSGGTYQSPVVAPGMGPGAEFIETSLPTAAMTAAVQTPWPVLLNTTVSEIPAGGGATVDRENGPTPGSRAVEGGGGGYLSNEVAYRSNRLRLELRPDLPGGHLHTPVLTGLPADPAQLTGAEFEANEAAIRAEVQTLLSAEWS